MQNSLHKSEMFLQTVCKKHEYILVTQTTTTTGKNNKTKTWMQCKHCGNILINANLK